MPDNIILGSGKLYVVQYTSNIPDDATLETDNNLLGNISGGASLTYKPTYYEVKDDLGTISKMFVTDEEVILKSGILTWNNATLQKLCNTGVLTTLPTVRTLKIGGVGNYDDKKYVIRFLHEDDLNGNLRITIVGNNQNGFEINFAKDKETVINAEFKALPQDEIGTLVEIKQQIVGAPA